MTRNHNFFATGTEIVVVGKADVNMYIQGLHVTQSVMIAKELQPRFVLGMDFLSANIAVVSFTRRPASA